MTVRTWSCFVFILWLEMLRLVACRHCVFIIQWGWRWRRSCLFLLAESVRVIRQSVVMPAQLLTRLNKRVSLLLWKRRPGFLLPLMNSYYDNVFQIGDDVIIGLTEVLHLVSETFEVLQMFSCIYSRRWVNNRPMAYLEFRVNRKCGLKFVYWTLIYFYLHFHDRF